MAEVKAVGLGNDWMIDIIKKSTRLPFFILQDKRLPRQIQMAMLTNFA